MPNFEDEFSVNPAHSEEPDDREIPDEDDGIDIMSATTPLSRKETAKLIATGKTSPLPLDEIADAMSDTNQSRPEYNVDKSRYTQSLLK